MTHAQYKFPESATVYVVGGCVRDTLLDRPVSDMDYVVVGCTPQHMLDAGFTQVGADFPVFITKAGTEFALARIERKVGVGYHGFTCDVDDVSIEQDLERRDLTINSMAYEVKSWLVSDEDIIPLSLSGELIDPYGGKLDLDNKVLRHTSAAFAEDPVRVLRLARFAARYDFAVDVTTMQMMCDMVSNGECDHLVPERVWTELQKALSEPHVDRFFNILKNTKADRIVFGPNSCAIVENGCTRLMQHMAISGPTMPLANKLLSCGVDASFFDRYPFDTKIAQFVSVLSGAGTYNSYTIHHVVSILLSEWASLRLYNNNSMLQWYMVHINIWLSTMDTNYTSTVAILRRVPMLLEIAKSVKFADLTDEQQSSPNKRMLSSWIDEIRYDRLLAYIKTVS